MAKAKINEAELEVLNGHLVKAVGHLEESATIWGDNFENLYNNFITNGFLNDLYEDAKSQYYNLANAGYFLSYVIQDAGAGMAIGGLIGVIIPIPVIDDVIGAVAGALIGAIIGLIRGITHCVKNPSDVKWRYDAKNVLEELLLRCVEGNDDNYIAIYNSHIKQKNMELALLKIRNKVNEYQQLYANLTEAAQGVGVDLNLASDGTTVLGIKSEVVIDGKTIELDASEAMAAFYTYTNTTMNGLVAAELISQEYGIEVDYLDVVKNSNAFMASTIQSDLYTHEFITGVLPSYNHSNDEVMSVASGKLGIDAGDVASVVGDVSGVTNLSIFPAITGAMLLGNVGAAIADKSKTETPPSGGTSTQTPSSGGTSTQTPTQNPSSGGTVVIPPVTEKVEEVEKVEEEIEEEITNDIEIEKVVEHELPESVEAEVEKDYDQLARDAYEFGEGAEAIGEFRANLSLEVQDMYFNGDLSGLREKLEGYGYSSPEVEAILNDPSMTINAVLEGETRIILAEKAAELAAADGVENFESSYNDVDFANLQKNPVELLQTASLDENVCELKDNMDAALEEYETAVEDTNAALENVNESKASMDAIKEKYETEYGKDTTKWTEEAVNEYNDSIKAYNESVENANTKMEELSEFKEKYNEANESFVKSKNDYYKENAAAVNTDLNGGNIGTTNPSVGIVPDVGTPNVDETISDQELLNQFMGTGN